jgi:hypothetical protein
MGRLLVNGYLGGWQLGDQGTASHSAAFREAYFAPVHGFGQLDEGGGNESLMGREGIICLYVENCQFPLKEFYQVQKIVQRIRN